MFQCVVIINVFCFGRILTKGTILLLSIISVQLQFNAKEYKN